jgi:hypothetical protein
MGKFAKVTFSLVLVILFLAACITALIMLFFSAWLHTYYALTRETVIAEVIKANISKLNLRLKFNNRP